MTTAGKPDIAVGELEAMLRPLTKTELEVEAAAWLKLLQAKATAISNAEIAVKFKNREIKAAEEAAEAGDFKSDVKGTLLADLAMLREQRTALVDRTNAVLDGLETKGGDVTEQRLYVSVVSGLVIEVSDTKAAIATIVGWLKSTEGGLRWAANFGRFAGIVFAAWLLSLLIGALVERAMNRAMRTSRRMSSLMRDFISKSVRRIVVIIGVVVALSALEIEVGPLLAVIAGAGFVIAFALQESLSNLASGIMILIYRPFDVGDSVEVANVSGSVKANIKMHELAESSVNFICRPWVKTADYWTVYWEVTRSVKEAFDEAGITIPFPQRDVHVHHTAPKGGPPVTEVSPAAGEHLVS